MKRHFVLLLLAAASASAQFHAPQTDFHDFCQRHFPVEAARVQSWRLGETAVESITYRVERTGGNATKWSISWNNAGGKPLRSATVAYGDAELLRGSEWFRGVWRQIAGAANGGAKAGGGVDGEFWKAHAAAGMSRLECIEAAFKTAETVKGRVTADAAAQIGGALARAGSLEIGGGSFFDSVITARAAAWLCIAEDLRGGALEAPWLPILVTSSRQAQARSLYEKNTAALAGDEPVKWMWRTLLTIPPAPVALGEAAARPEVAGPVFDFYGSMCMPILPVWAEIADKLWPGKLRDRAHDFGGILTHAASNRVPATHHATRMFKEWLEALKKSPAQPGDDPGVHKLADAARKAMSGKDDLKTPDARLLELLGMGSGMGGTLRPVAVVTQADLLAHGWEAGARQVGPVFSKMRILAGHSQAAKDLAAAWVPHIPGWAPFFDDEYEFAQKALPDTGRYELSATGNIGKFLAEHPPAAWPGDPLADMRRRWLLAPPRSLIAAGTDAPEEAVKALIRRVISEAGPAQLGPLADKWFENIDERIDELELREEISRAVPANINSAEIILAAQFRERRDPLAFARGLEALHWHSGLAFDVRGVMLAYIEGGASAEAVRFYEQAAPGIANAHQRDVTFAKMLIALALVEGRDADALALLERFKAKDNTGWRLEYSLATGDAAGAIAAMDVFKAKFPPTHSRNKKLDQLREWLPLLPAFRDPKHRDHDKALDTFPRGRGWEFAQWLLFTRAKLPASEAVQFFESDESENADKLIVAALNNDAKKFETIFTEGITTREEFRFDDSRVVVVVPGQPFSSRGNVETDILIAALRAQLQKRPRQPAAAQRPPVGEWLLPKLRAILEKAPAK